MDKLAYTMGVHAALQQLGVIPEMEKIAVPVSPATARRLQSGAMRTGAGNVLKNVATDPGAWLPVLTPWQHAALGAGVGGLGGAGIGALTADDSLTGALAGAGIGAGVGGVGAGLGLKKLLTALAQRREARAAAARLGI